MSVEVADQPEREPLIGQILANRYQIETRLGEGAMGTVYRARHVKVGRSFAVKVLHPRLLEDKKIALRFEREAELAGRLRHPNVIGVVDVGETPDGLRYMVMDFAAGDDLAAVLVEAPMPPERIIPITRQLLEGLYHAHEQGLIHRDFKPENVIIETDMHGAEVPRIVDFGIAILRDGGGSPDGQGRLTTNGLVLGTPHYMAPEQAVADPIDHRIDLFALGIVIYEMLSGKLPFDGSGAEVARANLLLDPPPISQRVPYLEVDPLLEAFARRLMAKKRDHRPATAKAARELLDLIDRDRAAAAAVLGVPLEQSSRIPAVTQPQAPQPRRADLGPDTFPPPIPAAPRASRLEAPALSANAVDGPAVPRALETAVAVDGTAAKRALETAVAAPLGFAAPPRRRRAWIVGGAGLALAGGIAAFVLAGRGDPPPAVAAPTAVPSAPPAPSSAPTAPTAPTAVPSASSAPPAPSPVEVAKPAVAAPETPPVEVAKPAVAAPETPTPTERPKLAETTPPATTKKPPVARPSSKARDPKIAVKPGEAKPGEAKPGEAKPGEAKPGEVKPGEVKPGEVKPPVQSDAAAIAARYAAVGRKLAALGPAANEMWPRYRLININGVMSNAEKRAEAAGVLAKLERDIAALPK